MAMEYQVGDWVPVKFHVLQWTREALHNGLMWHYEGSFKILKRVWKVAYKLELPTKLKFHPVFHVSILKPYYKMKMTQNKWSRNELLVEFETHMKKKLNQLLPIGGLVREINPLAMNARSCGKDDQKVK